ncbi:Indole-3-glycerol phosphate synthase / Phosphoribosylanthranilate isomerase [Cronobacter universalis NCTC 9529]|nr:Indole-3-glycerol phosphate synthase / Phosphoribosylanthranilate isomerase [Cronobacter universalis NCTC 9529]
METVLAKIVADKALWVEARKAQQPLASFQNDVVPSTRRFYDALRGARTVFILECKKASPSKGVIRSDFDPARIAGVYKHHASAISVLTDEKYFQGSFDFLPIVSAVAHQPVLCKDFIIDPYQIYLARFYQADACLLMLSVLDDDQYRQLAAVAHSLGMGVLTEVSNEEELERALRLEAKVVGINNRDLRDLSIDLNRTRELAPRLGHGVTVISESGIHTYGQVRELSRFANGFLIGSALMEHDDLETAVRQVLLGENKVCGLTRPEDAQSALQAGAVFGGLIFVGSSPRACGN